VKSKLVTLMSNREEAAASSKVTALLEQKAP
jgi:hypothetical protein